MASTDERFRPVNLFSAADGTLYVIDMYRGVVQDIAYQTEYLNTYIKEHDLAMPVGLGRIYRVVHDSMERGPRPSMSDDTPAELVAHLSHPERLVSVTRRSELLDAEVARMRSFRN